jgi:hypothetical protein
MKLGRIHQLQQSVKTCVFLAVIFLKIKPNTIAPNYREWQLQEQKSLELM